MTVEFTEDWFPQASCEAIAQLVRLTAGVDGSIVEVGCWEGRSTIALARAVYPEVVNAVDTWQGSPGEISAEIASGRDVYARFLENVASSSSVNIEPHRMGWREYFAAHKDPVRFCHIDATHSYEEVRDNIAAAREALAPGGIICGDDAHHPPVQQAVLEAFGDANLLATLWWVQCP